MHLRVGFGVVSASCLETDSITFEASGLALMVGGIGLIVAPKHIKGIV